MNLKLVLASLKEKSLRAGKRYTSECVKRHIVPEHQAHYCRDCEAYTEFCMVEDWVWSQIHKPQKSDIALCFYCMEKRLGRKITFKDLKHAPCNAPYFIGCQMDWF